MPNLSRYLCLSESGFSGRSYKAGFLVLCSKALSCECAGRIYGGTGCGGKRKGNGDVAALYEQTGRYFWNVAGVPTLNPYVLSVEEGKNDVTGNYYEFVRNPYDWKTDISGQQLPYFDTLAYTRISDEEQRLHLIVNGALTVSAVREEDRALAEQSAAEAGYSVYEWQVGRLMEQGLENTGETVLYAVDDRLKNFPANGVYCDVLKGLN